MPNEANINVAALYDAYGELMIMTDKGYKKASSLGFSIPTPKVAIDTLAPGQRETEDLSEVLNACLHFKDVEPIATPAGFMPNSSVILGGSGAIGDVLKDIGFNIWDPLNAAVYLENGILNDTIIGANSSPIIAAATASPVLTTAVAQTYTKNQYAGQICWLEMIPTVGGVSAGIKIRFMRRIVSHAEQTVAATTFTPTFTHNIPQSTAVITAWGIRPRGGAIELRAFNNANPTSLLFNRRATNTGGWRLSVDSGVAAFPVGKFTW